MIAAGSWVHFVSLAHLTMTEYDEALCSSSERYRNGADIND
jgi:hypothetical protein